MESFLKLASAINDETRVKILKFLLIYGKSCVCELKNSLGMIQSRLSRHLKILKEGGFVDVERMGSYAYYFLAPKSKLHIEILKEIAALDIHIGKKQSVCAAQGNKIW